MVLVGIGVVAGLDDEFSLAGIIYPDTAAIVIPGSALFTRRLIAPGDTNVDTGGEFLKCSLTR